MNILSCGVFDLIHTGHINFLNNIKNKGDTLYVLVNSDRYVSTYKRKPIINENSRLKMIQNIKCVDFAFIDDNEYLIENVIKTYKIDKVFQAIDNPDIWTYYYHIPISKGIMEFINYNNNESTTKIIKKIKEYKSNDYDIRYTKENILKSEKLYGKGWQTISGEKILENIIQNNNYEKILEIGSGLGGNCNYLSNKFNCSITGIDICKNMIDICNERNNDNNIEYILSDYINFKTNIKYDLILCRDVFLYTHTELLYKYLQKVKSQMSDGGVFVLIDYCMGENKDNEFTEYCINRKWNVISVEFYKKLLSDTGFNIINDNNLSQYYVEYCKNVDNKHINKDVLKNLELKLKFLENKSFEWHYFILS